MKKFLIILFLVPVLCNAQFGRIFIEQKQDTKPKEILVAQFNLSWTSSTETGWVSVIGDPNTSLLTANDTRSGATVTFSSINTGNTLWTGNGTAAAGYVVYAGTSHVWPPELSSGYFFNQQTNNYSAGNENFQVSGLNSSKRYRIEILSARTGGSDNRTSIIRCIDNSSTEAITVNSAPTTNSTTSNTIQRTNAGTICTFTNKVPNGSGVLKFHVCANTGFSFGYVNAIKVTELP